MAKTPINNFVGTLKDGINKANLVDSSLDGLATIRGLEAGSGVEITVADADNNQFNTTQKKVVISATGVAAGGLVASNNLSDVIDAEAARQNIGAAAEFVPAGLYFVGSTGSDSNDGSFNSPFATITHALTQIGSSSAGIIEIMPGTYTEDITISDKQNLLIQGWGVDGSHPIEIAGKITITGTSTRCRIKDLQIDGSLAGKDYSLVFDSSQGRHYLENVNIQEGSSGAVHITGTELRWHDFIECDVEGALIMDGSPSGTSAYFRGGNSADLAPTINTGYKLTLDYVTRIGTITHNGGKVYIRNLVDCNASGDAIISTASGGSDYLFIMDSNFQEVLDDSFSFKRINKTGTCPYTIHNTRRDITNDILTGAHQGVVYGYDLGEFTLATLPDAAANIHSHALVTDASGGRTVVRSDGTDWKIVSVEGATVS